MTVQNLRLGFRASIGKHVAVAVFTLLIFDSQLWGQQDSNSQLKPVPTIGQGQILDDINAIRNRMGGGVGETLKDMFPEREGQPAGESPQAMFDKSLRLLTGEQQNQATNTTPGEKGLGTTSVPRPDIVVPVNKLSIPAPGPVPGPAPLPPQIQKLVNFRAAARKLDEAAADLEDVGAYDLADQIRQQARSLRQMARDWDRNN